MLYLKYLNSGGPTETMRYQPFFIRLSVLSRIKNLSMSPPTGPHLAGVQRHLASVYCSAVH